MGNEHLIKSNPFIAGQTQYTVKAKKEEKTEQTPTKEVIDVTGRHEVGQEQPVAKADSELVGVYFGFNASKGVTLDADFAEIVKEALPDNEYGALMKFNLTINENRIKAATNQFEALVPNSTRKNNEFETILASVNSKYTTPEYRASIASHIPEIEEQLNPFFG